MNLCDDGHDEVCYEGKKCPFCTYIEESELEKKEEYERGYEEGLENSDAGDVSQNSQG